MEPLSLFACHSRKRTGRSFLRLVSCKSRISSCCAGTWRRGGKEQETVNRFWKEGVLDPESNVQFGEGGAGTFSDGKLNTLVKDSFGRNKEVLKRFVDAGASPDILYEQKPHLGTDVLVHIVQTMRRQIEEMGGSFRFRSKVTDLIVKNGCLEAVEIEWRRKTSCQHLRSGSWSRRQRYLPDAEKTWD